MPFVPIPTLRAMLHGWLRVADLFDRPRFAEHGRDTVDAVLDLAGRVADAHFAPHYRKSDTIEPELTPQGVRLIPEIGAALRVAAEAGLFAAPFDAELGGLQLPACVFAAVQAQLMAANVATASYLLLTAANARLLATHGTPAQVAHFAVPQIAGRAFGTMCLSEPQAGSSLADIATRALPDGGDALGPRYRLRGTKMWISGADHDAADTIVHLVLAKVPDEGGALVPGTKGISLFVVPRDLPEGGRNDVRVTGLNHKLGWRGTVNCVVAFGDAGGAVGWRVGAVGQGLALMFQMMNEARIGIGLAAAGLACRAHAHAVDYARERPQGRLSRDPAAPQVPIVAHVDVRRMLLRQRALAEGALALTLFCARLVDERDTAPDPAARAEAAAVLDLLTPAAKTWPSEAAQEVADLAIQVHGGYGYTRDFPVEQVWRDNRLNPIHEGTTGIQAIDLVGRKLLRDGGAALGLLRRRVEDTVARAARFPAEARALAAAWDRLGAVAEGLRASPEGALDDATPFLQAFATLCVGWLWLDFVTALEDDAGRTQAARYFLAYELPKAAALLDVIAARPGIVAVTRSDWFEGGSQ